MIMTSVRTSVGCLCSLFRRSLWLLTVTLSAQAEINESSPLVACEDGSWPPFTFMEKTDSGDQIRGVSYDLLEAITQKMGIELDFKVMPWKRCLARVYAFKSTGIEMFINGSSNQERLDKFLPTVPVYHTHLGYAFHRSKQRELETIVNVKALNPYHVCGVLGYNYDNEVRAGLTTEINTRSMTVQDAMNRVMEQKCDVFLTTYEVIQGGIQLKDLTANDNLLYRKTPGVSSTPVYYWISRSSPRAAWLLKTMNNVILELQQSGESDRIFRKYLADGDGID
jgi:polar amino acid transport system substrate-binding protein